MGSRGELWVVVQAVLLILLIAVPAWGPAWPAAAIFHTVGWGFVAFAATLLTWSASGLGRSLTPFPRPAPDGRLVTSGAYRFVRHPIYFAVLIGALGFSLATMSPLRIAVTLLLFFFFDMKARREERWLQERYPEYAAYKSRVKKLIPWIY